MRVVSVRCEGNAIASPIQGAVSAPVAFVRGIRIRWRRGGCSAVNLFRRPREERLPLVQEDSRHLKGKLDSIDISALRMRILLVAGLSFSRPIKNLPDSALWNSFPPESFGRANDNQCTRVPPPISRDSESRGRVKSSAGRHQGKRRKTGNLNFVGSKSSHQ